MSRAVRQRRVDGPGVTPAKFTVTAIMSAYNEEDIIGQVLRHLIKQGIGVYLLDHASTDRTVAEAELFLGKGLLHIEHFTEGGPNSDGRVSWAAILKRKEALARELEGDWFIHHDADEFRESPWPHLNLRESIGLVERLGYNAIDFELFNFWPTHDDFTGQEDVRQAFRYYAPPGPYDRMQIKAWKKVAGTVDLASTGGHEAIFPERRVFPIRFILRHYPIRSQSHGLRKVLRERKARFSAEEQQRGWHIQYERMDEGYRFIRDPRTLTEYDPDEARLRVMLHHRDVEALEQAQAARDETMGDVRRSFDLLGSHLDALRREMAELQRGFDTRTGALEALSSQLDQRSREVEVLHREVDQRDSELEALRREVGQRDHKLEALHQEVAQRDHKLEALHQEVAQRDQELEALHQELAQRSRELEAVQSRLDRQKRTVEEIEHQLAQRNAAVHRLSEEVQQWTGQAAELREAHAAAHREIADVHRELEARNRSIEDLSYRIQERVRDGEALSQELDRRGRESNELREAQETLRREMASLQQELEGRNRTLGELRHELDGRHRDVEELRRQLDQRNADAEDLSRRLEERDRDAQALTQELDRRAREVHELCRALESARGESQRLTAELAASHQRLRDLAMSRSWRYTAPLRAAWRALGGGPAGLDAGRHIDTGQGSP